MVDRDTSSKFGDDQRQGDDEDTKSQLSHNIDLWDTSGVRMSALCLNFLQDVSDAASLYSSGDRTMERTKKEPEKKKSFADFFRIKRRSKSKKKNSSESTSNDALDGKKSQSGQTALTPQTTTDGSSQKEKGGTKFAEGRGTGREFSFGDGNSDASGNRSATLPANGRNERISKRQQRKTISAEDATAKGKKFTKERRANTLAPVEQKEEKRSRLTRPLKRLETSIQKIITSVNHKFPATEDLAFERRKKENSLEIPTDKLNHHEASVSEDNNKLSDKDESNTGFSRDRSMSTGDEKSVDAGERQLSLDIKDTQNAIAPSGESPKTVPRGRARERGSSEILRRGRSEEAIPSKGQVKRIRRRALSREWVVVKTTTTEYTTTFSPTSKNDEQRQVPSNAMTLTAQPKSKDDLITPESGRENGKLFEWERNQENEKASRPRRYVNDLLANDVNNNDFSEFLLDDDESKTLSPVVSQARIELNQNDASAKLISTPKNSISGKRSANSNPSLMTQPSSFQENLVVSPQMKSFDLSSIAPAMELTGLSLLPQTDPFSFDDDESAKNSHSANFSETPKAFNTNPFSEATEVQSATKPRVSSAEINFHQTASDDNPSEANRGEENEEREILEQPSWPQNTDYDPMTAHHILADENQNEEAIGMQTDLLRFSGNSEAAASETIKPRWNKRKSAIRNSAGEKSPPEDGDNSSENQTTSDQSGFPHHVNVRDWPDDPIQAKNLKNGAPSPRLSRPRWTKRKAAARGSRQQSSSLLPVNSDPTAAHQIYGNGNYGSVGDGDLIGVYSLATNSAENKPRWTTRQPAIRGHSRALVGVNSAMIYETKGVSSPTNARKSRTPKLSPKLRGTRREDSDRPRLDSGYETLNRKIPRTSRGFSSSSQTGKQRPLIDDESSSFQINNVIPFSTDASSPDKLEPTPEIATRRNDGFNWEDSGNDCNELSSSNLVISNDEPLFAESIGATRFKDVASDDIWSEKPPEHSDRFAEKPDVALAIGEKGDQPLLWNTTIDVESSSDSDHLEYEHRDSGLHQGDFDITPTNDEALLHWNTQVDDDGDGGGDQASDCDTISDRNESRSHDDFQEENDESSSWFDASQDGIDAAYFADIDANEGSAYQDGGESLSTSVRTVNRSAYLSDTDPESAYNDAATGVASHARDWSSAMGDGLECLEAALINESPVPSSENFERRGVETANDENSMNEMRRGSGFDLTENYEDVVAVEKTIRDGQTHPSEGSRATKGFEMIADGGQDPDLVTQSENFDHRHEEKTNVTPDLRSDDCSAFICDQITTQRIHSDAASHATNEEFTKLRDVKDEESSICDSEIDRYKKQFESAARPTDQIYPSVDGAVTLEESTELAEPTIASDSNRAESMSETTNGLSGRGTSTTDHQRQTGNSVKTEEIESVERLPQQETVHLARHPTVNPLRTNSKSRTPSSTHRVTANRKLQLDDDDRSNLLFRRLHIDVPYSDSGYSETEVETLSPCSFRSSISLADTVAEEGGGHLESLTDDDVGGGGSRFGFYPVEDDILPVLAADEKSFSVNVPGLNLTSNAWSNDSVDASKVPPLHPGGAGVERMMTWPRDIFESTSDATADDPVFDAVSPSTKQGSVFAPVFSKRSELEAGSQSDESKVSLESCVSYDSGRGSSAVDTDESQFTETNLTDNETTKFFSFCPENQDKQTLLGRREGQSGVQINEFIKDIVPDSCERQLSVAFSLLEDAAETNDFSLSQSSEKYENLREDRSAVKHIGGEILDGTFQQKIPMQEMDSEINAEQATNNITEITDDLTISPDDQIAISEKERQNFNRFCGEKNAIDYFAGSQGRHTRSQGHAVDNATEVTRKAKGLSVFASAIVEGNGSEFCNRIHNKETGSGEIDCAINKGQVPIGNIDSKIDKCQAASNDVSEMSTNVKNFADDEFAFNERDNYIFKRLRDQEIAIAKTDLAGHHVEEPDNISDIPYESESLIECEYDNKTKEGDVFNRLCEQENAFSSIRQGLAATRATEVSNSSENSHKDKYVSNEKEGEIFIRIPKFESAFKKVDSPGNHDETDADRELDRSKGREQSKISVVSCSEFVDANKVFTDSSPRDISDALLKNGNRAKSAIVGRSTIVKEIVKTDAVVVYPIIADTTSTVECEVVVDEKGLTRALPGDDTLPEEPRQGLEVLTWHENAEMYSIYRQFPDDNSTDEEWPRPSAWIWNGSRYTASHRPGAGRDTAVCYPDPSPCRSFSCPIPFAAFSLVRDRKLRSRYQSASALENERQETERRSFEAENTEQREEHSSHSESMNSSATTESAIEDQTSGSASNGPGSVTRPFNKKNSRRQKLRGSTLNREDKCREDESYGKMSSLIGSNDSTESRMSENDCCLSSSSTTQNISRKNNKPGTGRDPADSVSSTSEGVTLKELETDTNSATKVAYAESGGKDGDGDRMDEEYPEQIDSTADALRSSASSNQTEQHQAITEENHNLSEAVTDESDGTGVNCATTGEINDSLDSHLRRRSRLEGHDDVTFDDVSIDKANHDDNSTNNSAPHHGNTSKSALNYFLVSTAGQSKS